MPRLAIVVALKEEFAAVQAAFPDASKQGVLLVRGGMGWNSATRAVQRLLSAADAPNWICSSGFCGGLADTLAVGDILLADSIYGPAQNGELLPGAPPDLPALRSALDRAAVKTHVGALVTVKGAVFSCDEKRLLGRTRNAVGVDMESYAMAVAAATGAARAKVFALRSVSDSADDELPPEIGGFLTEDGKVRGTAILKFAVGGPRNMKTLWSLKTRTDKAGASLTAAWKAVWPAMSEAIG